MSEDQKRAVRALMRAVEEHLSAYAPSDEMSDSDADLREALDHLHASGFR